MKRKLAVIMSIAMLAALNGCGETAVPDTSTAESSAAETTAPEETEAEAETTAPEESSEEEAPAEEEDEENYDTGDASLDNVRNQDEIGEKELLVLSFGTSYNDSRRLTIGAIEDALDKAFPDYAVRRGFTANIIIDHVNRRDGILIDDVDAALQRAIDNNVKTLVVQPTHLMHGAEYDELTAAQEEYRDQFETDVVAEPLRGEVGADAGEVNA
ncbi:MAG: sirohydrochlorin cobaltochelatase, partial [Oscillospiraceae bacterium]|nr:sirohydrochlorin cobaltochelatase [Oscillospiraceae bacterium]